MSALSDFLNDPPAFLRRHHVRFRGACTLAPGAAGRFALLDLNGRLRARTARIVLGIEVGRTDAGRYEIRQAGSGNIGDATVVGSFEAVWSGYQHGAAVRCTLGGEGPRIMLTQDLSGCTIVSSAAPDGAASFSHYNLLQPADPTRPAGPRQTRSAEAMHSYARSQHSGQFAVLTKEDYYATPRRGGRQVTTAIGWRRGATWSFWIQYAEENGDIVRIRDVQQMQPGTRFG